jgi:hypothetical protein
MSHTTWSLDVGLRQQALRLPPLDDAREPRHPRRRLRRALPRSGDLPGVLAAMALAACSMAEAACRLW